MYGKIANGTLVRLGSPHQLRVPFNCKDSHWEFENRTITDLECRFNCTDKFVDFRLIPSYTLDPSKIIKFPADTKPENTQNLAQDAGHHCKIGDSK
uniref:Uncharacterized protein n=1 Tax=Caenorhabditis tropicalis TaxID=1561998 RepID=A0A1I7TL78_9PELO